MDFLELKITGKKLIATDAVLLSFEQTNGHPVEYEAGQFLTFKINFYGREVLRSYSICTTPGVDNKLAVVIKRRENGEMSRFIIDHLFAGAVLHCMPPAGRFTVDLATGPRTLFFIAAGSGIAPVYALIRKVLFREVHSKVILIYQNRDEASVIFREELEHLHDTFTGRFTLVHLLSTPSAKGVTPKRLNNSLLERLVMVHDVPGTRKEFFVCGPGSFMRMCQFVLRLMGFAEQQIRRENFVIDPVPPPPVPVDTSPKNVRLHAKGQTFDFTTAYPLNILQAALNNNIHLPYSCRGGRCSACTVRCISGRVHMTINDVLTDRDLQNGYILTCVGYAETDLELEL